MNKISYKIQDQISRRGKPEKARWLENYVKHDIKSKGTGIPDIRLIVKNAAQKYNLSQKEFDAQTGLLNDLMSKEYTEDKLAAILYIQLFWNGKHNQEKLNLISNWFDQNRITDWNVCDWLCVRILTPLVEEFTESTIRELKQWNGHKNLWKARASLVPFALCDNLSEHKITIQKLSAKLIKREERFCKTAVGWVMREYSKIDAKFVTNFLTKHEKWTTNEVIRNATKYIKK